MSFEIIFLPLSRPSLSLFIPRLMFSIISRGSRGVAGMLVVSSTSFARCGKDKELESPKSKEGLIHATLLKRRAVFLNGSITEESAKHMVAQLIFLELDQPGKSAVSFSHFSLMFVFDVQSKKFQSSSSSEIPNFICFLFLFSKCLFLHDRCSNYNVHNKWRWSSIRRACHI